MGSCPERMAMGFCPERRLLMMVGGRGMGGEGGGGTTGQLCVRDMGLGLVTFLEGFRLGHPTRACLAFVSLQSRQHPPPPNPGPTCICPHVNTVHATDLSSVLLFKFKCTLLCTGVWGIYCAMGCGGSTVHWGVGGLGSNS